MTRFREFAEALCLESWRDVVELLGTITALLLVLAGTGAGLLIVAALVGAL